MGRKTYTRDDIKQALKNAGLSSAERHSVYRNLPGDRPRYGGLAAAGNRIYLKPEGKSVEPVIVAGCTRECVTADENMTTLVTVWRWTEDGPVPESYKCWRGQHFVRLYMDAARTIPIIGATDEPITQRVEY